MEEYRKSLEELEDGPLLTLFVLTKMGIEDGTYPEVKADPKRVAEYINDGFSSFVSRKDMIDQIIKAQT